MAREKNKIKFIFDLDGTLTKCETLPMIARHFGLGSEIGEITKLTVSGERDFQESFTRRVAVLGCIPVAKVADLLGTVELYPGLLDFIHRHREYCAIATGNLDCWIGGLAEKLGCVCYSSKGRKNSLGAVEVDSILDKRVLVEKFQSEGFKVIFIGDGDNDAEAMKASDIALGAGMTHNVAPRALTACQEVFSQEEKLCETLEEIFHENSI